MMLQDAKNHITLHIKWFLLIVLTSGLAAVATSYLVLVVAWHDPLSPEKEIVQNIVPLEPGPGYDVLAFCNRPTAKVVPGVPMEVRGVHYVLQDGTSQVDYKDTLPSGSNPTAQRYWITPDGIQHTETVQMTIPALECIKRKALQ
jgi:hypothetical protein